MKLSSVGSCLFYLLIQANPSGTVDTSFLNITLSAVHQDIFQGQCAFH